MTKMTASDILVVLARRHDTRAWVFFPELRLGTGYGGKWEQRIDAWAMSLYPLTGLQRIAYEIKVARGDFLAELRKPEKRRGAMGVSNYFYFVAPPGVIHEEEVPGDCGLMIINDDKCPVTVKATFRDCPSPHWRFVASLARRIAKATDA